MASENYQRFTPLAALAAALALAFAVMLLRVIYPIPRLFSKRIGRRHAQAGAAYIVWLAIGFMSIIISASCIHIGMPPVVFDTVLGLLGITLTLTAAHEFGHKNVHNRARCPSSLSKRTKNF